MNGLFGWCSSIKGSMSLSGRRSSRLRLRSAAQGRPCVNGFGQGKRAGLTSTERERLKQLERENLELKRANEILRKAAAFFAQAELDRRLK